MEEIFKKSFDLLEVIQLINSKLISLIFNFE